MDTIISIGCTGKATKIRMVGGQVIHIDVAMIYFDSVARIDRTEAGHIAAIQVRNMDIHFTAHHKCCTVISDLEMH